MRRSDRSRSRLLIGLLPFRRAALPVVILGLALRECFARDQGVHQIDPAVQGSGLDMRKVHANDGGGEGIAAAVGMLIFMDGEEHFNLVLAGTAEVIHDAAGLQVMVPVGARGVVKIKVRVDDLHDKASLREMLNDK